MPFLGESMRDEQQSPWLTNSSWRTRSRIMFNADFVSRLFLPNHEKLHKPS
jgi:hypothetical protein